MSNYNLPYLLFDLGGTNTRLSVTWNADSIGKQATYETPDDFDQGINKLSQAARSFLGDSTPGAIAGGIAGPLDPQKTLTVNPPNLPGWKNMPLKTRLQELFRSPVFLENDTAFAGLGESVFGAGKGYSLVAYLTVSTGVNGIRIVQGKIEENVLGFEIGHQIVDLDGSVFPGSRGELEDFISGRELKKRFNLEPSEITNLQVWNDIAKYLSIGIHNTLVYWSPEIVVLGGSIIKKVSLDEVTNHLSEILTIFPKAPILKKAELGDTNGLWGALHYLNTLTP